MPIRKFIAGSIGAALFVLAGASLTHAQNAASRTGLGGFHLVLLAAHAQDAKWMPQLPSSVMKALQDAGEFLPYKGYTLADQAYVKGRGGSVQRVRLQFAKQEYVAAVEAGESSATGARVVEVSLSEILPLVSGGQEVLSATFSASDGETVVVGTSRVRDSQQALVLLVTLLRSGTSGK
jgi:hypothetical protein